MEKEGYHGTIGDAGDISPHGKPIFGLDILSDPVLLSKFIQQDHGLDKHKKQSLLTMLDSPEWFDHLVVGAAGAALAKTVASYADMSPPAQTLMSLAGFGVGNIIYNNYHQNQFTEYNQESGKARIIL
jgi:hypothetical protein